LGVNSVYSMKSTMSHVLHSSQESNQKLWEMCRDFVLEHRNLEKENLKRLQVIDSL